MHERPCWGGVRILETNPAAIRDAAAHVFQHQKDAGHKTNFGTVGQKFWDRLHRLIGDAEPMGPTASSERAAPSICEKAGICLHTRAGQELFNLRNKLLKSMKEEFPVREPVKRGLLKEGHIVCRLMHVPDVEDEDDQIALSELWGLRPRWFHICDMSLNPYEPTLSELVEPSEEECVAAAPLADEVALKATA